MKFLIWNISQQRRQNMATPNENTPAPWCINLLFTKRYDVLSPDITKFEFEIFIVSTASSPMKVAAIMIEKIWFKS